MKRNVCLCVLWLAFVCVTCEGPIVFARSWPSTMTIAGRVISEESKLPIVAELSVIVEGFSPVSARTDASGNFSVTMPEATLCKIVVKAQNFDEKEEIEVVSGSGVNYFEIQMVPLVKLTLEGTVFGRTENDEQPLDAQLTVYINSDFIKEDSITVMCGKYSESFTNFGWYIIDFSAPGYENTRDTLWVMDMHRKNIHRDYHLLPLDSKLSIALTNIHFAFGSSSLMSEAFVELDYLSGFLTHNLTKRVEITGHTDNTGPIEYNMTLSKARAQSVTDYLLAKGVNRDQLITIGCGQKKPVDSNSSAIGKANNRRVELVLYDKPVTVEIDISALKNIHFDFGTATLNPDSYAELDYVAKFFNDNPSVQIEITGHTDNTGPEEYNNFLSQERAKAVATYLKSKGVTSDQLIARGYGRTKPIDSNTTLAGKTNNRRVELIVLNK